MLLSTSRLFSSQKFPLENGDILSNLDIAYETYGTLNEAKSNSILVCHGYTNNQHAAGDNIGWFSGLIGPGKAINTEAYYVITANMLGSAYGSTGPASIDPTTKKPYGLCFPDITVGDIVNSQIRLLDHLGVKKLISVIGNSFGGHLAFQWGVMQQDRIKGIISVVSAPKGNGTQISFKALLNRFSGCPGWNGGQYYGLEKESGVYDELIKFRIETLKNYGCDNKVREDFGSNPEVIDHHLALLAKPWAEQFDANSLIVLRKASIQFNAWPKISNIQIPILYVLSRTDNVFPISKAKKTMEMFKENGVNVTFYEIDSDNGHRAPSIDWQKWENEMKNFLDNLTHLL